MSEPKKPILVEFSCGQAGMGRTRTMVALVRGLFQESATTMTFKDVEFVPQYDLYCGIVCLGSKSKIFKTLIVPKENILMTVVGDFEFRLDPHGKENLN